MERADTSIHRSYVSQLRQQQAAATRERVVRAAAELFAEKGYAATTMPAIARRAGVSTETVQNHGPKVELLRSAIAAVSFGGAPGQPVAETDLGTDMVAAPTLDEAIRRAAELLATVNEGAHGVWSAFSEAARADAALAAELRRLTAELAGQNLVVLREWGRRGWLRTDLELSALALRSTAIGSVELWDRVVRVEGHSRAAYVELVSGLLRDSVAAPPGTAEQLSAADELSAPTESQPA